MTSKDTIDKEKVDRQKEMRINRSILEAVLDIRDILNESQPVSGSFSAECWPPKADKCKNPIQSCTIF